MARPSCCTQLRQKVCMQVSSSGASYRLMQMAQVSSVMHRSSINFGVLTGFLVSLCSEGSMMDSRCR